MEHLLGTAAFLVVSGLGAAWSVLKTIQSEFKTTRTEGEQRTVRTHQRLDEIRDHIDEKCVSKDVHIADMRRIDDALNERVRQHQELSSRLDCPARRSGD